MERCKVGGRGARLEVEVQGWRERCKAGGRGARLEVEVQGWR